MTYKVSGVIEKDDEGFYAHCPELPGCQTQGDSIEEAVKNLREAIELYLSTLNEDERAEYVSKEILTTSIEVTLA